MRKYLLTAALLALLPAAPAAGQEWGDLDGFYDFGGDFCTATSFSVCMNFEIRRDGTTNNYQLRVEYVSTTAIGADEQGMMTAAGLYRGKRDTNLSVSNAEILATAPSSAQWSIGTNQLNGDGPITLEVTGSSDQGITNGLPLGGYVIIGFTSDNLGTYDLTDLYARSHIQSFGLTDCSIKPDSRADGNVVGDVATIDAECGTPTNVVPEPITLILLGSGLAGVGGVGMKRRRREGEDIDEA